MSDPVKNAEVEDVLSSIRRLVSEDKRPLQTAPVAGPSPVADRLVLTPALRVQDDVVGEQAQDPTEDDSAPQTVIEPVQKDLAAPDGHAAKDHAAQDHTAEVHTAKDHAQADQASEELDTLLADTSEPEVAADDLAENVQALAEDYDDDPYNFADTQDKDGDASTALLLTNPSVPEPEQDQTETPDVDTPDFETSETAAESAATEDAAPERNVVEAVLTAEQKRAPDTLSEKIAALETAIGAISEEWEPDAAGQDAYAGSEPEAMAWEDDVVQDDSVEDGAEAALIDDTVDVTEAVAAEQEDVKQDEPDQSAPEMASVVEDTKDARDDDDDVTGFSLGADDQLLDEETLREMINEIVHSELQGALGERITRNVRRLVRREIHRALTARDLG